MANRLALLQSIATTIADFRAGEITQPDAAHVEKWIQQFPVGVQDPILEEVDHVFKKAYWSRSRVEKLLGGLATNSKLTGSNPSSFWTSTGLLNIQGGGTSQHEMLKTFDTVLQKQLSIDITQCKATSNTFIYLDDGIFTGTRALQDLTNWLPSAPQTGTVHIISIALYTGGEWHLKKDFGAEAAAAGKNISLNFWRCIKLEGGLKKYLNNSDILLPTVLPSDTNVQTYAKQLKYPVTLRQGNNIGPANLFSSHNGRLLLEQEFLKKGVYIRQICPNLRLTSRPLGYTRLETLGFGNLVTTFRNCPNNCPLVFWVGEPWYPLLPRRTNAQSRSPWP